MTIRDHEIELVVGEAVDIEFMMVDSSDHLTGKPGLTPTVQLSKNRGAFANMAGTVQEIGGGWYVAKLTSLDTGILGTLIFKVTATGGDPVDFVRYVIPKDEYDAKHSALSTLQSSYCSVEKADDYFDTRLDSSTWTYATLTDKEKALKTATRLIDRLNFKGAKKDSAQALEFPRDYATLSTVPEDVEIACCEIALQLLEGRDPEMENENTGVQATALATGRLNVNSDNYSLNSIHGIPSIVAWNYLKPYLRDRSQITLSRID